MCWKLEITLFLSLSLSVFNVQYSIEVNIFWKKIKQVLSQKKNNPKETRPKLNMINNS